MRDITVRNLTPHPINLHCPDGRVLTFPGAPMDSVPRIPLETRNVGTVSVEKAAIPVRHSAPVGDPTPLPEPVPETIFVVSRATAEAAPHRPDLVYPDDAVRDENGRVVGCRAFGVAVPDWENALADLWRE